MTEESSSADDDGIDADVTTEAGADVDAAADTGPDGAARATLRTAHGDAATAERVAAALSPDHTADIATTTDGETVHTTVSRATTGSLQATVDDYVVNLRVAAALADRESTTDT